MDEAKKTAIERWLSKADHDLATAKAVLVLDPPITDTACFHAQQTVEKCLKAYLVFADVHVEKTHYLPRLVELCSEIDPGFQDIRDLAVELTDYAVANRYPEIWREIPIDEARDAVEKAKHVTNIVRTKLGLDNTP